MTRLVIRRPNSNREGGGIVPRAAALVLAVAACLAVPASAQTAGAGGPARIAEVRVRGVEDGLARRLEALALSDDGPAFDPAQLETDVERMLRELEREGRPLAGVVVDKIEAAEPADGSLVVTLTVDAGPVVPLKRIDVAGSRASQRLVSRLTDLQVGRPLRRFEPETIRARLVESDLFASVALPQLVVDEDSSAVIRIDVQPAAPGTFDLVLGYLPPAGSRDGGQIVGNGHLALRNLFGGGRSLSLRLNRLPNQVSSLDVSASDPYVAGLPVGASFAFHGLEQDSTFGKQVYRGEATYHVARGVDVFGGFAREVTGPGQAGLRIGPGGRQVIPSAEAWFLGLGARISTVDRVVNSTRGLFLEMNLESGRKERIERRVFDGDTSRVTLGGDQRRLRSSARYFVPILANQVLALGGDAALVLSDVYDRSDLFRFGGATSLRGYDEERFLGRVVARALAEYRFLIDLESYAYAFFDLGYVDRPNTPDLERAVGLHPGYGIGIQFRTAVGLVNVSAALNPESGPTQARIHAGLTFGL